MLCTPLKREGVEGISHQRHCVDIATKNIPFTPQFGPRMLAMPSSSLSVLSWIESPVRGSSHFYILVAALPVLSLVCAAFAVALWKPELVQSVNDSVANIGKIVYSNFLKPHSGDDSFGQQAALESFYKVQV